MLDGSTGSKSTENLLGPKGIKWENMWPPIWKATNTRNVLIDGHPYMTMDRAARDGVDAACVDLMFHLLDEDVQEQYLIQGTGMPTLKKTAYDPRFVGPLPSPCSSRRSGSSARRTTASPAGSTCCRPGTRCSRRPGTARSPAGELATQMTRDGTAAIERVRRSLG